MSEATQPRSFTYSCEQCGNDIDLTPSQLTTRTTTKWGIRILCDQCNPNTPTITPQHPIQTRKAPDIRPRTLPPSNRYLSLKPSERNDYGVTVTIREQTTLEMRALIGNGPVKAALTTVCETIDGIPGDWRIITISTPATIFGDLQGSRDHELASPETRSLSPIGRLDLLEPGR